MTTSTRPFEIIDQARRRYLAGNPVRLNTIPAFDHATGEPAGEMTFPNIGDIQIVGCKLGMEYLAICHDEDAVEDWIHTAMGIVKNPELAGILFANVFRGINTLLGLIIEDAGIRDRMHRNAVEAWGLDFMEAFGTTEDDDPATDEPF
ncbi:hypothetical protein [Mycobacterium colombiense]|uniref:Uncharacterized protein n=1 Tax=Mycobacterium colombiense TaxID=339268 RepID=A0A1A2YYB0_9MYCO|nr:hypothetical protein [Mycobacterium colombiense]OBI42990.1 hypothetical protein A5708_19315 [Mycobacterium colombiense]